MALFEAICGIASKYTGRDRANIGLRIIAAVMMLWHSGWTEATDRIVTGSWSFETAPLAGAGRAGFRC